MEEAHKNLNIESHLDENTVVPNGFFLQTLDTDGLLEFVTQKPTNVLPTVVAKFYLHLQEGSTETSITDPSTSESVPINLLDIARAFHLYNEEPDPEYIRVEIEAKFRCFIANPNVVWKTGLNRL